jgi:hypothetical protein
VFFKVKKGFINLKVLQNFSHKMILYRISKRLSSKEEAKEVSKLFCFGVNISIENFNIL